MAAKRADDEVRRARFPTLRREEKPAAQKPKEGGAPVHMGALAGLQDMDVRVTLEWGRSQIAVSEALELGEGGLLRLEQLANEPVDVRVNGKLFARGKLVVVGDNYGVQLTELVDSN